MYVHGPSTRFLRVQLWCFHATMAVRLLFAQRRLIEIPFFVFKTLSLRPLHPRLARERWDLCMIWGVNGDPPRFRCRNLQEHAFVMPIQRTKTVRRRSLCQLACSGLVHQPLQLLGMITKAAKPHSPNLNPSTILGRSSCRNNFIPSTMSVRPMIDESYCWNDRSSRPITITKQPVVGAPNIRGRTGALGS